MKISSEEFKQFIESSLPSAVEAEKKTKQQFDELLKRMQKEVKERQEKGEFDFNRFPKDGCCIP